MMEDGRGTLHKNRPSLGTPNLRTEESKDIALQKGGVGDPLAGEGWLITKPRICGALLLGEDGVEV